MEIRTVGFSYTVFSNIGELPLEDRLLLENARGVTALAYAPYSGFHVGAAGILSNDQLVTATNQENASYPVGICAERVLLSAISAVYPGDTVKKIAISYRPSSGSADKPVFPCGICRQSLLEQEIKQGFPIKLVLAGATGDILLLEKASDLIPFGFTGEELKK